MTLSTNGFVSDVETDRSDTIALNNGGETMHSIQCLRFVAAAMVVIFHVYVASASSKIAAAVYWFGFGKAGVHIFFVISGYIMYLTSFARPKPFGVGRFLLRRIERIYPIYWIFVLLYLAAAAALGTATSLSRQGFWGMLALVPGRASLVIGPAWTLSYEVYFYMIFGIVMWLGAKRGTIALTAVFTASVAIGAIVRPDRAIAMLATNALLLEFLMGVWIARLTLLYAFSRNVGRLALVLAVGGYALGLAWGYDRLPSAIVWGLPSALLIAGAVITEQRRIRAHGPVQRLSWLGDSSYSLYLSHLLLITLAMAVLQWARLAPALPFLLMTMTLGCICFAAIFHARVERPLIGILHRLTAAGSGRRALAAQIGR